MIRVWLGLAGLLLAIALPASGRAESGYDVGKRFWLQGQYPDAYSTLLAFRKQRFGRRPEVDYMIGTSACRMDCCRVWGMRFLGAIPESYPLSAESRTLIAAEQRACEASEATLRPMRGNPDLLGRMIAAGVTGRAKVFSSPDQDVGLSTYPTRRVREIPATEFASRLMPRGEVSRARAIAGQLSSSANVKVYERFVIASMSGHSPAAMDRIAATLERFLAALTRYYQIDLPDNYVTIYLVPHPDDLRRVALRLHGLDVTPGTIGYAFQDDLSIVAFVTDDRVGTVFHELVHLSVRSTFGDIPQWLDEGLAGLYEVSTVSAGGVLGEPNWREQVLRQLWPVRPKVEELLGSAWFPFEVPEAGRGQIEMTSREAERQVAFMATARYFCLFLEREGHLRVVYRTVRDRDIVAGESLSAAARASLESAFGASLSEIDEKFARWFLDGVKTTAQLGLRPSDSESVEKDLPVTRQLPNER